MRCEVSAWLAHICGVWQSYGRAGTMDADAGGQRVGELKMTTTEKLISILDGVIDGDLAAGFPPGQDSVDLAKSFTGAPIAEDDPDVPHARRMAALYLCVRTLQKVV